MFTLDPDNLMLRLSQSERAAAWKGHRYTVAGAGFRKLDKAEIAERKRLDHLYEEEKRAKARARLQSFLESRR